VAERLVLTGAFDGLYGIGGSETHRRGRVSRRDLLLQIGDLDEQRRSADRVQGRRARGLRSGTLNRSAPPSSVQLSLDLGEDRAGESIRLPEMSDSDRVRTELEFLGLDVSRHVIDFHQSLLDALGVVRSRDLLAQRSGSEVLVAGVKVATQTPPIRSGRRVIFLTLDDATGPVDATFFEDVQGPCAATVFGSWLLVVRGVVRRTGRRGISVRATGAWDLGSLQDLWTSGGVDAVRARLAESPEAPDDPRQRRVLVHSSGFRMSPYSDIRPAGDHPGRVTGEVSRALWHRSPGSSG
jgi:error-prone DNA polymerase